MADGGTVLYGGRRRPDLGPQFALMESRLYRIITTPAMVLTWLTGLAMVATQPSYGRQSWFLAKFSLVLLLSAYHGLCARVMRELARGDSSRTGEFFRVANEAPTLVLVLVVLLVVFKDAITFGTLGWVLAATWASTALILALNVALLWQLWVA